MTGPAGQPPAGGVTVTGSANVQVGTGNVHNVISLGGTAAPTPDTVDAPPGLDNLPPASAVFEGRDVAALDDVLVRGSGQAAVLGLGGVGKSELAAHYARAFRARHSLVWWITADTAANVQLGLAALTSRLHPVATLADARSWALGWLQTHRDWLLVLDNVEDVADIEALLAQVAGRGRVVVTTRRDLGTARWARLGLTPLRLGVLDRSASVQLLQRLTGLDDRDGAGRLAAALGDLPLALEQAAGYVSQHEGLGFDDYVRLLTDRFALVAADPGEGDSARRTVATIWRAGMDAVAGRSSLAVRVLRVLAWLGPDAVPVEVMSPPHADPVATSDALAVLVSFSLINRRAGEVSVHRLVQAVVRQDQDAAAAVSIVRAAIPEAPLTNVAGWPRWNQLLPHIDALTRHAGPAHSNTQLMYVNDQAAVYRQFQGQVSAAVELFEQVLAGRQRVLGDNHPDTLTSRHNLAGAYQAAGRVAAAIELFEQARTDRQRVLGDDHPDTLASLNDLAFAYRAAGRLAEAIVLFEQARASRRRVLGDDHPDTMVSRNNLASAYQAAGRVAEAVDLFEQIVTDSRRVLGDDHPDTLANRYDLAYAYHVAGRVTEAIDLFEQVLADRQRVLGDDHPDTLSSRSDLAYAYRTAGRLTEATELWEQVLRDRRRVLGDDHPRTTEIASLLRGQEA
ncbi:tetratricopeptide repeat protein [Actinoplanes sp. CA-051413]|uniref:tetratricopeptide repeat protein n=1 Tax=Actinoplanes sp. CA-051413 TaxID=3239899 RepID=UPI003D954654